MIEEIIRKAKRLTRQCDTYDPFRIACDLGIDIQYKDLGRLKGMYTIMKRNRFIVLNINSDEYTQKLVCAHELGHDQFHRELAVDSCLQEFIIYNMNTRPEYEANIFAAELLLPDEQILDLIDMGYDSEQIARKMYADVNLVGIKISTLIRKGYNFRPLEFNENFFK